MPVNCLCPADETNAHSAPKKAVGLTSCTCNCLPGDRHLDDGSSRLFFDPNNAKPSQVQYALSADPFLLAKRTRSGFRPEHPVHKSGAQALWSDATGQKVACLIWLPMYDGLLLH